MTKIHTRYMHSLIPRPFPQPVFHRFQYEIRRGKAWEIWSRAVPSGRHVVDTRRVVPNEEYRRPVLYCPSKGWMSECSCKADDRYRSLFTMPGMDRRETGIINGWAPPPVCLPSVYLDLPDVIARDQISQASPPPYLILETMKYWRWEQPGNEASTCIHTED